jgi:hypothetical protein
MMHWEDERYVRVYTRDTIGWKALKWQGQTVVMHLLRKVDRAGVFSCEGFDPAEAVAEITGLPEEVVAVGLQRAIERETIVRTPNGDLLFPNFIKAQDTPATDAQRARESRARRRDRALRGATVTERDATVTERDATVTERDATVTAPPGRVTNRHSVPSVPSVPNRTAAERETRPRSPAREPLATSPPSPSAATRDEDFGTELAAAFAGWVTLNASKKDRERLGAIARENEITVDAVRRLCAVLVARSRVEGLAWIVEGEKGHDIAFWTQKDGSYLVTACSAARNVTERAPPASVRLPTQGERLHAALAAESRALVLADATPQTRRRLLEVCEDHGITEADLREIGRLGGIGALEGFPTEGTTLGRLIPRLPEWDAAVKRQSKVSA